MEVRDTHLAMRVPPQCHLFKATPVKDVEFLPMIPSSSSPAFLLQSPHRHYVLALPKMLRAYFQRHRPLLKHLCTAAHQSLTFYLRSAPGKSKAHPAI